MRRGFTLIELLVVIAIIAILAAILFPVFARARAKAQQNNCLSNVKQLSLGVLMYVSDYDQRFPHAWRSESIGTHWHGCIYPYVKNLQIYACPSTNTSPAYLASTGWGPAPWVSPTDYRFNPCLGAVGAGAGCYEFPGNTNHCGRGDAWGPNPPLAQESVHRPAEMIMIYESTDAGGSWAANPDRVIHCGLAAGSDRLAARHNEGANIGYVDGHAKWQSDAFLRSTAAGAPSALVGTGWSNRQ